MPELPRQRHEVAECGIPPVCEVSAGDPGDIQARIDAAPDAIVGDGATEAEPNGSFASKAGTVNATVNELIIETIRCNPGIRRPALLALLPSIKRGTLTRRLADLAGSIEFRWAPKTGGIIANETSQAPLGNHVNARSAPRPEVKERRWRMVLLPPTVPKVWYNIRP